MERGGDCHFLSSYPEYLSLSVFVSVHGCQGNK